MRRKLRKREAVEKGCNAAAVEGRLKGSNRANEGKIKTILSRARIPEGPTVKRIRAQLIVPLKRESKEFQQNEVKGLI